MHRCTAGSVGPCTSARSRNGVGEVSDSHGAGDASAVVRARPDVGRAAGDDEVSGVQVAAVRGLADEEGNVDALGEPAYAVTLNSRIGSSYQR